MTTEKKKQKKSEIAELSTEQVVDYLNKNAAFIRDNLEQLAEIDIPHNSGVATSLIERQVNVLRKENLRLKKDLSQLIENARNNEELSQKIHNLFKEIMNVDSVDDLMATLQEQMQSFFNTDVVLFRFFSMLELNSYISDELVFTLKNTHTTKLKKWLKQRKPACGELTSDVFASLFEKEKNIQSMAVVPLFGVKEYGVLMLGSSDKTRFSEAKGTIFLAQLGELVSERLVSLITPK